MNGLLLWKVVT